MSMMKTVVLLITIGSVLSPGRLAAEPYDNWPEVYGPYLGQESPGMKAEIFAPGIISTHSSEINSVFAPDRDEFYFTTWTKEAGTAIMLTRQVEGRWTAPAVASFSTHHSDVDPAMSYDGKRIFFGTRRPRPGETETRTGFDIWFANRNETGWDKAQSLGPVVNSGKSQIYPTVTRDGTLYFQALREEGYGRADIYRCRVVDGVYQTPENLGSTINSEHYEGDVFVAHDESYLIISIYGREDGFGEGDLYVSFCSPDGAWSPPHNMGPGINSSKRDFCPMVTPDGKYLFFSSKRAGEGDIYWADAMVIEALRND